MYSGLIILYLTNESDTQEKIGIIGTVSLSDLLKELVKHRSFVITSARHLSFAKMQVTMTCNNCASGIIKTLKQIEGVTHVECDVPSQQVLVASYIDLSEEELGSKLMSINKPIQRMLSLYPQVNEYVFNVEGMKCEGCEHKVQNGLKSIKGVYEIVEVSAQKKRVIVRARENGVQGTKVLFSHFQYQVLSVLRLHRISLTQEISEALQEKFITEVLNMIPTAALVEMKPGSNSLIYIGFQENSPVQNNDEIQKLIYSVLTTVLNSDQSEMAILVHKEESRSEAVVQSPTSNDTVMIEITDASSLETINVSIEGMSCAACVAKIESAVLKLKGITKCAVNLLAQKAYIKFDANVITTDKIVRFLNDFGYTTHLIVNTNQAGKVVLQANVWSDDLVPKLFTFTGVTKVECDQKKKLLTIEYNEYEINVRTIIDNIQQELQIENNIYHPESQNLKENLLRTKEIAVWRGLFIFSIIFGLPILITMILDVIPQMMPYFEYGPIVGLSYKSIAMFILSTPIQFIGGFKFYYLAFLALKKLSLDMNSLVTIGAWLAYGYSIFAIIYGSITSHMIAGQYFEISSSLIMFLLLGRWLENVAKSKTSQALVSLMDLQPATARLIQVPNNDQINMEIIQSALEREIPVELVAKNDLLKVIPGDKIPVDGIVVYGQSSVNEALLTGESVPQEKKIGSEVIGGTVNVDGMLIFRAERVGQESTLSSIAKLVEDAQTQKPKIQALADRLSGLFVPVIILISIIVFGIWTALGYTNSYDSAWRPKDMPPVVFALLLGITTIIISCPCALGLATPTAVLVGTGVGASNGVLIKGGSILETTRNANIVCFDKTGTLTLGKMTVTKLVIHGHDQNLVLQALLAAESSSEHPIGKAIVTYCKEQLGQESLLVTEDFMTIAGRGVACKFQGSHVHVGNLAYMQDEHVEMDDNFHSEMDELLEYNTPVYVSINKKLVAIAAVADTVKEESKIVVAKLHTMGLRVYMITGDQPRVANHIGKQVGIPEECIFASVTPAGKALKVKELSGKGNKKKINTVIMVGDGINDSPSLAEADVGIAVAEANNVAMECAGIVLMSASQSLRNIVTAIDLSRTTYRRIIFNFIWAFGYNFIAIPIAAGALMPATKTLIPPWVASIAMVLSSLSVLVSSLLLKLYRKPKIAAPK